MEHSQLPLRLRLLAMYLLTQNRNAINALTLKRQLVVSYKTPWLMKHELMQTSAYGRPLYVRLTPVQDFTNKQMRQWASRHLCAGRHVVSDGTRAHPMAVQHRHRHGRRLHPPLRHGARVARAATQPARAHRAAALRRAAGRPAPGPRGRRRAPGPRRGRPRQHRGPCHRGRRGPCSQRQRLRAPGQPHAASPGPPRAATPRPPPRARGV